MFFSRRAGHKIVYRGNPINYDFSLGDLTTDGNPHDLDLSGIIPAGTKAVLLNIWAQDDAAGSAINFVKKGVATWFNSSALLTQVTGIFNAADAVAFPDSNGVIQYKTTNTTFNFIDITVKGWVI